MPRGKQCRTTKPKKFTSPRIHQEYTSRKGNRVSYEETTTGRRVMRDIEEADDIDDSSIDMTTQYPKEARSIESEGEPKDRESTNDRGKEDKREKDGGKVKQTKKERRHEKSKRWWKRREQMENRRIASIANASRNKKDEYEESTQDEAYWKRRETIEKRRTTIIPVRG